MDKEDPFWTRTFVRFSCDQPSPLGFEPTPSFFTGSIRRYVGEEWEKTIEVGKVRATYVGSDIFCGGVDPWCICDAESQALVDAYDAIFEEDGAVREEAQDVVGTVMGTTWAYIDSIEIKREHRGRGLGMVAMLSTLDFFQRAAVISCLPHPMLDPYRDASPDEDLEVRRSSRALADYWKLAGFSEFNQAGKTWLVLNTDYARPKSMDVMRKAAARTVSRGPCARGARRPACRRG